MLKGSFSKINYLLNGPDGLGKELAYVKSANRVIYHNAKRVGPLFKAAFNIDVDLTVHKGQFEIRNHIVHRFGYTEAGSAVCVSKRRVKDLIASVDTIVEHIIDQIRALPQNERMYP